MKVFINDPADRTKRVAVDVTLIRTKKDCIFVRLPDGNIIERKKSRDLVPDNVEVKA
jgi:hypothetical protein